MIKKITCFLLTAILSLTNVQTVFALNIYDNNDYVVYYNSIKNNTEYKVAAIDGGDRVFYDLDGIISIFKSKGGKNINVYKLAESLKQEEIKSSISSLSSNLGSTNKLNKDIELLDDFSLLKENNNILITTMLNDKLIYGITNQIGTNKFIPFAIIKYDVYGKKSSEKSLYETILFNSVDIGSDVESYIDNGKIYYPIRFVSELLGGTIDLNYGQENTNILVNFDIKQLYDFKFIFSSTSDEKNKVISKNQCVDVQILKDGKSINKYLYNLKNPNLHIVQKKDLGDFLSQNVLKNYENKSDVVSICNSGEKEDLSNVKFDMFVGSENGKFIPTNLTFENNEITIKNTESVNVPIYENKKIKNIEFKKSNGDKIDFDNNFNVNQTKYITKDELKSVEENVCYSITFDDDNESDGCTYLNPTKNTQEIVIDKYSFTIKRSTKDSNTKIKLIKYKKKSDNDWKLLEKNSEGIYKIEGTYSDYELLIEPDKETSSVKTTNTSLSKEEKQYKLVPTSNAELFEIVAEDGSKTEYKITFDDAGIKETIEKISVYQGNTELKVVGPDNNNQYKVDNYDKSLGTKITIKYTASSGKEESVDFYPNTENKNTGNLNVKNNAYTILFVEKPNIPTPTPVTNPVVPTPGVAFKCSSIRVTSTVTTTASLNMRDQPNTSGKIIKTFKNGIKLNVVGNSKGWYEVKDPDNFQKCGWISGDYVEKGVLKIPENPVIKKTKDESPITTTSKQIKEECLTDEFQNRWRGSNKNRENEVSNYLKSANATSYVDYQGFGNDIFYLYNYENNYSLVQKYLTLALVLERGQNNGGISYDIRNGSGKFTEFYGYLMGADVSNPKNNNKYSRFDNVNILDDIEYCINNLVDKTNVGNKVQKSHVAGIQSIYGGIGNFTYYYNAMKVNFNKK